VTSSTIHVTSDFMCPWCFIGISRLVAALGADPSEPGGVRGRLVFEPFLLDPTTPEEGLDLRDKLRRKYGDPEPMFRRVEEVARASGLQMDFSKIRRGFSSVRAHTLVSELAAIEERAGTSGRTVGLVLAIFRAYFSEGRDISSMGVLIELGREVGLDESAVTAVLEDGAKLAATRAAAARATVRAVPSVTVGDGAPITGAADVETYRRALARA
jgi:predicted DsbA family dithiol-disulfide isomerase